MVQKLEKTYVGKEKDDLVAERNEPKALKKYKEKCGIALGDFYVM
jgi:hypothetical protein